MASGEHKASRPRSKSSQVQTADGHKMCNKKTTTHPTSGAELPPKTKQSNEAGPPRKSTTYRRKVSRRESVGLTDGDKSSRPKDVDRSAAADENCRDDSKSTSNAKRSKQRENRARNESSDADVTKRNADVSRDDEAKKSPNLTKRKSLGSSPNSPLRSQRERLGNQYALRRKSTNESAGSQKRPPSSLPESAAGGADHPLKNSTRRKQAARRKSAPDEGPNAAEETTHDSGDGKSNHGTKSLRPPGEDDNMPKPRRRPDIIANCDNKEKDLGLRRRQSAEAMPREPQRAARAPDKPPARNDKVIKTNKSETCRKDNSESVQRDRGRPRHPDKPSPATKDSKQADSKKSRNIRIARSTSPEHRGKGGAGIEEERRNLDERIKRSKSVPPRRDHRQRIDPQHQHKPSDGSKIPSTFSVYRSEFLEEMANMSVHPPNVVGDVARSRHRAEHTSETPLPPKKEKNRNS